MKARLRRWVLEIAGKVAALPLVLRIVLMTIAVLNTVGLSWGMPASDGWDVDGVAPRDFLPGLAATFTPGQYFVYPPLHLALLGILTLPITFLAALRAGSFSIDAVMPVILLPPYMTAMAMVSRMVSVLMSLGAVLALAMTAAETAPEREKASVAAGAATIVGLSAPFAYYSHVTNLDVPYLFWASLGILSFTRAVVRDEPRRLRAAAVFVACAVATKDQAYAMFLLAFPAAALFWVSFDRRASAAAGGDERPSTRERKRELVLAAALLVALLMVLDGVLVNPSGFRARVAFLSGAASQDFAAYSKDFGGRVEVVRDTFRAVDLHYPRAIVPLAVAGLFVGIRKAAQAENRAGSMIGIMLPLLCAISFTLFFNLAARRVEHRFTLPQMLVLGLYAGRGVGALWYAAPTSWPAAFSWTLRLVLLLPLGPALHRVLRVDATFFAEPRYAAENWLATHAAPHDVVEIHGLNVYLLRPPPGVTVVRVDQMSVDRRNPYPGIVEVQAKLSDVRQRNPRFIVVNDCYVWRYLPLPHLMLPRDAQHAGGRILPHTQDRDARDSDATNFFTELFEYRIGYHVAMAAEIPKDALFQRYEIHASLGCPMRIFERDAPPAQPR